MEGGGTMLGGVNGMRAIGIDSAGERRKASILASTGDPQLRPTQSHEFGMPIAQRSVGHGI
eukprot:9904333-Alexandrium_andersonii.AAC.1